MSEYILEMKDITKNFPGVRALDQVSFKVKRNHIHALVGENGAGEIDPDEYLKRCLPTWFL